MGLWALSWFILLSRYMIFDTGLLPWKQSLFNLTIYQMLIFISSLMLVWSTHIFINKPLNKWWLYGVISLSILSASFNILCSSLIYKLLLPIFFGCFVCIWVGLIFIHHLKLQGIGRLITGYSYILWSLLNIAAPFTLGGSSFLPWSYSIGGILRLIIAIGTLMVYFEKTRVDLVIKETQYRLLTENAIDIIYHYQLLPEKKIQYISPSVLTATGYPPENYYADNKLIFRLIHPDDYFVFENFINNLPSSTELPLTLRLIHKNKTILWLEQKGVPIYNDKGHVIALEGIIRDITIRKNLEQMTSLLDRMNMVGNMAATVAHEIRNPMTTVRGYLQVLGRKEKNQVDKDKFELMIEEIDRANTIIREYLSLSREKAAVFKTCSLNNIIETLFPLIQADASSSKVYVQLDLISIPELLLDENEIRQLLLNLVRNGIEAMPGGGNLIIHTFSEGSNIILSISDQGSGIPSHVLDKLGTPFFTTKDTGTGLGLPLCYQIAQRHNAKITIDTSKEGTTFFVRFS
jgi:PAS domain S-box-containing protein